MRTKKVIEDFLKFCSTTSSPKRLQKIEHILIQAEQIIKKPLDKLSIEEVAKFLTFVNQSDFKQWTKNDYKKIFKRFIKWKYRDMDMIEGMGVKDGFKCVSPLKAFNKERINKNTLITPDELEAMIRTAKSLKWKAIISFTYESGFRGCEVRTIKWKNLKFDDSLGICRAWILSPKTKNAREVPVKDCVLHLKRWRDEYQFPNRSDNDLVFPSQHDRNEPMGLSTMTEMFKRICREAKIRPIFPYLLRHSRIYELQKRLPEKIAAKFAGHSVETSEIYNHLADDDVEESMLKTIYPTKEITKDERNKYDKEISDLKQGQKDLYKFIMELSRQIDAGGDIELERPRILKRLIDSDDKI